MHIKQVALAVLLVFNVNFLHAQPVREHGALQVKNSRLCNSAGMPVMLRGVSLGWHNWWPRFYNENVVNWLYKDWNANVVRAAMGIEPKGGYKEDPLGSTRKVSAVVDGAIKEGVYVIIDWHSHSINLPEAKVFFSQMAKKYGRYPNVIYEVFNEPDMESWDSVKAYSIEVIKTIRQNDPDNIILVGNPHWDQDIHLVADAPIEGFTNLMYTVHFYAATHKQALRDRCDYALKKGIPIFVSESAGMEASGNGPLNVEEWTRWITWMEEKGISWITWSVSDKNETCSVLYPTANANGKWTDKDLKESGLKTKAFLKKYNKKYAQ